MIRSKIKSGSIFFFKNLALLEEFSRSIGNPSKDDFEVLLDYKKEFIVVKL
ncbi:hypothetical protein [Tenacibaculum aiptasiae]|uniref:hypothetical protein n=1 Tax=Tenacibaculum aiptasiae TaxID=426481 RepID=UPI00232CDEA3|nr:hypothetical protein [Tenacibaculum aiptasiae]